MSHNVVGRVGEIGLRMALGARRGTIMRLVLREAVVIGCIGITFGLPAAFGASRSLESFLWGIEPNDAGTMTVAAGTSLLAVLLAAYVPAWRASRIDPTVALRHE